MQCDKEFDLVSDSSIYLSISSSVIAHSPKLGETSSNMKAKLTYFDMTGLGEPVRIMLAAAKIPFEDIRVDKQSWDALKPTLRWQYLPMLEIDGLTLFQTRAICRYIARKAGLAGTTPAEEALADMVVDTLDDFRMKLIRHYYTPDSPEREKGLKEAFQTFGPEYLGNFEKQVEENGGYFVGGKLTWADLMTLAYTDYLSHIVNDDLLAGYPKLDALMGKVKAIPEVNKWRSSRPKDRPDLRVLFQVGWLKS